MCEEGHRVGRGSAEKEDKNKKHLDLGSAAGGQARLLCNDGVQLADLLLLFEHLRTQLHPLALQGERTESGTEGESEKETEK